MQRRLTAGRGLRELVGQYPATLMAFDLLQGADGRSPLSSPLTDRRDQLVELLASAPSQLSVCPQTTSRREANEWLTAWTVMGVEGLVGKPPTGWYTPGKRGWLKAKSKHSHEVIVAGVTSSVSAPETLLFGRYDRYGRLRFVGRSHQLTSLQRRELAPALTRSRQRRRGGIDHHGHSRCPLAGPDTSRGPNHYFMCRWSRRLWWRSTPTPRWTDITGATWSTTGADAPTCRTMTCRCSSQTDRPRDTSVGGSPRWTRHPVMT
jgi:hypothetical protein